MVFIPTWQRGLHRVISVSTQDGGRRGFDWVYGNLVTTRSFRVKKPVVSITSINVCSVSCIVFCGTGRRG
jgi:hypothetical protein